VLILSACSKEGSVNAPTFQNSEIGKSSGVVMDKPSDLAKVPLMLSSDFLHGDGIHSSYTNPTAFSNDQARGGKTTTTTTKDVTPPSVNITSPANGASVSGTVGISVSASDDVGLSSVTLTINGTLFASWVLAPYSISWTPSANGNYTLVATAKDKSGNVSSHTIVVSRNTTIVVPPPTTSIPASFLMQTPPVMYQGSEGSCVSMAIVVQHNIEKFYTTNASVYDNATNIMSPEFLYNYTKVSSGCGSGASMVNSLDFIYKRGNCNWSLLPYSYQNGCDTSIISSDMKLQALNNKIPNYRMVLTSDLLAMKTCLANKHPLSFVFTMDSNFYNATPGYIWNSRGTLMSTHALTIVGYDDSINAFKAQNSWGTSWGDQGFIWIDYNFLSTIAGNVYAMY